MLLKMLLVFVVSNFAAYVNAGLIAGHRSAAIGIPLVVQDPPHYEFQYAVHDAHTGDIKDQFEHRRGDYVTGRYSLIEPDGQRRIVEYTADPLLGFNAEVRRELPIIRSYTLGAQHSPAVAHQVVEAWPVPAQHR